MPATYLRALGFHALRSRSLRSGCALIALAIGVTTLVACKRNPYTPTECVVWSEKDGAITGQVYLRDGKATFSEGATRRSIAHLDAARHVIVSTSSGDVDAAVFDGQTIDVLYIEDSKFVSEPLGGGRVVFYNGVFRSEFRYNSACSTEEAVVGSVTLLTTVFPPGEATAL
jgi:hypothetical protein